MQSIDFEWSAVPVTNVPHVVPVERTWKNKKVVHSLPPNVPELIRHVVRVLLDNSHKICLSLNCMWLWPSDSRVPVHSVAPTGKSCSLVKLYLWCADLDTP